MKLKGIIRCDRWLLWTALLLLAVGTITVYTSSVYFAHSRMGSANALFQMYVLRLAAGALAMWFFYSVDHRFYRKHAKKAMLFSIALLVLTVLRPENTRGATSTFMGVQPNEIAKLVLVVYLADVLSRRQEELVDFAKGLLPRLVFVGIVVGLMVLQKDFGSALGISLLSFTMLFLGGARLHHIGALGLIVVPLGAFAAANVDRISGRVGVWRSMFDLSMDGVNTREMAYQVYQSLIAFGSGGIKGRGIGSSLQRAFIPDSHTDFAFSIWAEELGILGALFVVGLFVVLMLRGLRIARRQQDLYGMLLASGLTVMVALYAAINIGVVTGTIPTTGLPLPFLSYGGMALVGNMAAVGILLNMSKQTVLDGPAIVTGRENRRRKRS